MGYVAVKGGKQAIFNADKLVDYFRLKGSSPLLSVKTIEGQLRLACDKVMSEASLYAPTLASLSLKQTEGDIIEASFLLRAYRSTLPRISYSEPADTEEMFILRRISSAFKNIIKGQILGHTRDYVQRFLQFNLLNEKQKKKDELLNIKGEQHQKKIPKIINVLRKDGLLPMVSEENKEEPYDITRNTLIFPLPRSARLQSMARGEEGGDRKSVV